MKLPAVPLDAQDRRIIGMALVIALALAFVLLVGAGAAGLAVRVFALAAWGG